jgi:hypothetical protein
VSGVVSEFLVLGLELADQPSDSVTVMPREMIPTALPATESGSPMAGHRRLVFA